MKKYAWLIALALTAALALILSACTGQSAPPTPNSTITPTVMPPGVTSTTNATIPMTNGVPDIPHPVTGYENCLVCHQTGVSGSPVIPADHAGRTNSECMMCHHEATSATPTPTTTQPASGVPEIPHTLVGRSDCLACHQTGGGGAPAIPADHAGRTDDTCTMCHQQAPTATSTATAPTTTAPATTTTATATPTQTATGIPEIPHTLVGRSDCLSCHQTGVGGAPAVPADHAGRTDSTCTMCHQQAATSPTTTAPATATPTTTTTATTTPTQTSSSIPQIPHFTDGYTQCLVCHQTGIGGAPAVPADHAGRTDSMCTLCHTPAASQTAFSYPTIPHDLTGRSDCLMCHQTGVAGAPAVPADHAGRTDDMCTVCHKTAADD